MRVYQFRHVGIVTACYCLLLLALRCVFCSEDKIIRGGGHSVNEDLDIFFKKVRFQLKKAGLPIFMAGF
ncbi:hypothetical protein ACL9RI_05420 [Janthinobacterium sp. Mn2066]|uniref:hypothetical protein n=1 Tax=Janthinobacterium sp. Mn2066 TaxID=3395264 RepID=UPI003BC0600A